MTTSPAMTTSADRVAAKFATGASPRPKTASSMDGPWVDINKDRIAYWADLGTLYGRVHHITGALKGAETLFEKIRDHLMENLVTNESLRDGLGYLTRDISDIYVTLSGDHSIMAVHVTAGGLWSDTTQDKIVTALGGKYSRGYKDMPR